MRLGIVGTGKMGSLLKQTLEKQNNESIAAVHRGYELQTLSEPPELIFDFSHPDNLQALLEYALNHHVKLVLGTTNYTQKQQLSIHAAAMQIPIIQEANFSLGIAVLKQVLKQITPILAKDFDIEIIEKHHNQKVDAPSGTAKQLAQIMNPMHQYNELYGRRGECGQRGKEIGIHAIRGGNLAGEHTILYLGEDESLEITHKAVTKQIFIHGAIKAAAFLSDKEKGYYTMEDVLSMWEEVNGTSGNHRYD